MSRCLDEKTLFLLSEGSGGKDQRLHLEGCQSCAQRCDRIAADVEFISAALQKVPPSIRPVPLRMPIFYRSLPVAVALLLGIALVWGESRLWKPISPSSTESAFNSDLSQFLDQVNDALFSNATASNTRVIAPDSDVASVQAALGQNCSYECRELLASLGQERSR